MWSSPKSSRVCCSHSIENISIPPSLPRLLSSAMSQLDEYRILTFAGKVLVHCAMGISRSATLVLAFLMIRENKTLVDALNTVRQHRGVCPNSGFLSQLRDLDIRLTSGRGRGGPLNL
ncbi:UNVERIFIED_CONTAM: hypothetical protein K2H54_003843 [Gekko kuhli]